MVEDLRADGYGNILINGDTFIDSNCYHSKTHHSVDFVQSGQCLQSLAMVWQIGFEVHPLWGASRISKLASFRLYLIPPQSNLGAKQAHSEYH